MRSHLRRFEFKLRHDLNSKRFSGLFIKWPAFFKAEGRGKCTKNHP